MAGLTEQHIREIEVLVEARGVEMKELSYDLVDHICCMIEEKMKSGKNYTSALEESLASFGEKGIRHIQEETTFLLTKNILAMKKTMHITGITAAIFLLLGSIFKIQHLPGAGVLYVLGAVSLCLVFMPLFLTVRIKEKVGKLNTWSNVIGIVSAITLCFGILFKIMHWSFASILMNIGGALLIFIFLPLYIYNGFKINQLKTGTIVPVIVAIAGFSLMFSLVKLRNSTDIVAAQHNIQYNIDNENTETSKLNIELLQTVNIEKLKEKDRELFTSTLEKTNELTVYIDNLLITSVISLNEKGMTRKSARATLTRNYAILSSATMNLNLVRGASNNNENLETLLLKVSEFELEVKNIIGSSANIIYNQSNFKEYISRKNQHFPIGIVLQDLTTLKLEVQKTHTTLLAYYKGKAS